MNSTNAKSPGSADAADVGTRVERRSESLWMGDSL